MRRDALNAARNVLRNAFDHVDFRGLQAGLVSEILGGLSALAASPRRGSTTWALVAVPAHIMMAAGPPFPYRSPRLG